MLRVRLKIGDGDENPVYTDEAYGLVYVSADNRLGPDVKAFESTAYPEEEGEHLLTKTVDAAFDYKVKFYVNAEGSLENANQKLTAFNAALFDKDDNGIKTFKRVWFYNDYKKTLIVGYPYPISEATDFWRDSKGEWHDVVVVEWKIRVTTPSLCDFNLTA